MLELLLGLLASVLSVTVKGIDFFFLIGDI